MNNDYVPRDVANGMRSIGFDKPCDRFHTAIAVDGEMQVTDWILPQIRLNDDAIPAPSFRDAFTWFRDEHGYYPSIELNHQFGKWLSRWCNIDGSMGAIAVHETYPEAEYTCLMKFIELIKYAKQNG